MAGYSWTFTVSPDKITEVTVTDGVTTVTVQATGGGMIVPFFETSAFPETTEVTLSATGYNDVTAIVGTTSSVTFTEASTTPTVAYLSDGTNTYEIEDSKARADIQALLSNIYPVGSMYMSRGSTCPLATLIPNSTWTLVSSGKALWTGNGTNGGTTINAGLPNITGTLERIVTCTSGASGTDVSKGSGAFSGTPSVDVNKTAPGSGKWWNDTRNLSFNASNSNSIYGNSTTVQPPAYVVNVWERTA